MSNAEEHREPESLELNKETLQDLDVESNIGGNVKSSAAASQRRGCRGMRVSRLRNVLIRTMRERANSDENAAPPSRARFRP